MRVVIVTAATGNAILRKNIESVANQTHKDVQHLILVDGPDKLDRIDQIIHSMELEHLHKCLIHCLPYSIGKDRWNGHRIYAAATYMAECDYIMYLDEDNYLEPTHVEDCLRVMQSGKDWTFSFRRIVDKEGNYICNDDCESLGLYPSVLNESDYFVDVSCYFLPLPLAVTLTPIWYRKAREPNQPEVDRLLTYYLRQIAKNYDSTYNYTVNYTVGNNPLSVQKEFFLEGNKKMLSFYNNKLPWKK